MSIEDIVNNIIDDNLIDAENEMKAELSSRASSITKEYQEAVMADAFNGTIQTEE